MPVHIHRMTLSNICLAIPYAEYHILEHSFTQRAWIFKMLMNARVKIYVIKKKFFILIEILACDEI